MQEFARALHHKREGKEEARACPPPEPSAQQTGSPADMCLVFPLRLHALSLRSVAGAVLALRP